jgi:hypothetical protein
MTRYEILVGEPWDFNGPDGQNRVLVDFVEILINPFASNAANLYILLKVVNTFQHYNELVEYMIASPRYMGDTVDEIVQFGGTVGISRIRQGVSLTNDHHLTSANVEYFLIGRLRPLTSVNTDDKPS